MEYDSDNNRRYMKSGDDIGLFKVDFGSYCFNY